MWRLAWFQKFDAVDVVFLIGKQLRMIDPIVFERAHIKRVIAAPTIRIYDAVRHDFALYNWQQSRAGCVRDNLRVNAPTPL